VGEAPAAVSCARCGTVAAPAPLDWSCAREDGRERWLCPPCTRENVRSIEGRLDEAWW
jgi:hypothetical protein